MKRRLLIVLVPCVFLLLLLPASKVAAQKPDDNPFDVSVYQEEISALGVPTTKEVEDLAAKAKQLFESGNYEEALPALQEWARKANWLANIVSGALEPFYSASYDARKQFPYDKVKNLTPYESAANRLKLDRNHAMVMQAECLVKLDKPTEAVGIYLKALDLTDIEDWTWWTRALNGLYRIIGMPGIQ
ncbi:MAG: hypothetical protein GX216_11815 [Methanomicrobiales archaeon]|jgi:tetratricopeptide (TPR) repeat protein|nr:hypothetical protein [Methanomicrobiales archaeon]